MPRDDDPEPRDRTGWQGLDEWRGDVGRRWAAASGTADAQFGWLSDATYRRLGPLGGTRVLDVGCGNGGTTRALARLSGRAGSVTGIDANAEVLAIAGGSAEATSANGATITWLHGDAQTQPWPARHFDVVFSRLGTMFFGDAGAAFANLHRATRPGGRLAFTCWPAREHCPVLLVPLRALAGVVPLPPSAPAGSPNPFSLGDEADTMARLAAAGWRDVEVEHLHATLALPDALDDAVAHWLATIPVTLAVPHAEGSRRTAMAAALAAVVPADRRIDQRALLFTARA